MSSLLRVGAVVGKEIRQLSRDRLTFGMIVGIPLFQILLFGYAINLDVRHLRAGVADQATTQLSRQLVADVEASQVVDIVAWARTAGELEDMMRRGEITVGIVIPADFERRVREAGRPAAQLLVDGSDPTVANIALRLGTMRFELRKVPIERPSTVFEVRNYYNPERRSAVQIVPALIGVILTLTMVLFTSVAVVRERERGNLELLITTPIRNLELMIGKIIPSRQPAVHRRLAEPGANALDVRQDAVSGDAAGVLRFPASALAVGLHVSVRRHAAAGATNRPVAAADPFHRHRSGRRAAWRGARGADAQRSSARDLLPHHDGVGDVAVSQAARLRHCRFPRGQTLRRHPSVRLAVQTAVSFG